MAQNERALVAAFIEFLQSKMLSLTSPDHSESLEVAIQCLQSVFNTDGVGSGLRGRSLIDVFTESQKETVREPTEAEKAKADALKTEGNELMKTNKFQEAIEKYDEAIKLHRSAVFYCNRAAAYSKLEKHQEAIDDCKKALDIDSTYSKAYGRMGLAYSCLNRHRDARDCYQRALELDPENESFKNNLDIAEAKLVQEGGANMAGGSGASASGGFNPFGAAGGGFPDISNLLNNPAIMNMASQMMTDPSLQQLMFSMASGAANQPGGGQGLSGLLDVGQRLAQQMQQQNPELVEQLRRQFQNGGGPPPPPGQGPPPNNPPQ